MTPRPSSLTSPLHQAFFVRTTLSVQAVGYYAILAKLTRPCLGVVAFNPSLDFRTKMAENLVMNLGADAADRVCQDGRAIGEVRADTERY